MNKSSLITLHEYNRYANNMVLATAKAMSLEALSQQISPSHGTVQALLTHMLTTEFFFLARTEGKPINPKENPEITLSLADIEIAIGQVADERQKYLGWVTDEKLDEIIDIPIGGQMFHLARWQLLAQSFIHSIHHRGELSIVMSSLGHPLPTLDPIIQFIKTSGQNWPWE